MSNTLIIDEWTSWSTPHDSKVWWSVFHLTHVFSWWLSLLPPPCLSLPPSLPAMCHHCDHGLRDESTVISMPNANPRANMLSKSRARRGRGEIGKERRMFKGGGRESFNREWRNLCRLRKIVVFATIPTFEVRTLGRGDDRQLISDRPSSNIIQAIRLVDIKLRATSCRVEQIKSLVCIDSSTLSMKARFLFFAISSSPRDLSHFIGDPPPNLAILGAMIMNRTGKLWWMRVSSGSAVQWSKRRATTYFSPASLSPIMPNSRFSPCSLSLFWLPFVKTRLPLSWELLPFASQD